MRLYFVRKFIIGALEYYFFIDSAEDPLETFLRGGSRKYEAKH